MVLGMTERTKPDECDWLTPAQASAALGITTTHLARLANAGDIRAIRPGGTHRRYASKDVEAILAYLHLDDAARRRVAAATEIGWSDKLAA